MSQGYGWNPQRPDRRDHEYVPAVARQAIPVEHQLDFSKIPVLNQGQQGSCTGHGTAAAVMYDQQAQSEPVVVPSREFIYYNARVYEGTENTDAGAQVRDAIKVVVNLGVPSDSDFPYNDQIYDLRPPARAYSDATRQEALVYEAVRYGHLHQAIASGFPFVYGFTVYESFESGQVAQTGIVPIPEAGERVIGGHCVCAYGYNASFDRQTADIPPRHVKNRNSWDSSWGHNGDFYLPQWFFDEGQCSDFWVIRRLGAR